MAEHASIFMALRAGARFDAKRFAKDKIKTKPVEDEEEQSTTSSLSSLDFFKSAQPAKNNTTNKKRKSDKEENETKNETKKVKSDNKKSKSQTSEKEQPQQSKSKKKNEKKQKEEESDDDHANGIDLLKKDGNVVDEDNDGEAEVSKEEFTRREKIHALRNTFRIKANGNDIPDPIESFDELHEKYQVRQNLIKAVDTVGYKAPTPIQMQVTTAMLRSREVLAVAPTGSGKTMAFIIPILATLKAPAKTGFRAVVVSPTRELATQIHREFNRLIQASNQKNWKVCLLTKATALKSNLGSDSARFDILVTTPMRLVHLVNEDGIKLNGVEWLIFDEADKLFDEKFIEQIDKIIAACSSTSLKVCLFSATMLPVVEQTARTVQKDPIRILVGAKNTATDTITQSLVFAGSEEGKLIALRSMIQDGKFTPPVLIFVQSKERAQQLFHELIYDGINVDVIHAERTQAQRNATVDKFRTGEIWVLITTELMARGIDFKNVQLVINYDFPSSVVSYIHRIGRTGRAGRKGSAITLYTEEDFPQLRLIANVMRESGCKDVPEWIFNAIPKVRKDIKKKLEKRPIERDAIENKYNKQGKQIGDKKIKKGSGNMITKSR